jgi:tetratricopeptide (TPR) repeat protein
MAVAVDFYDVLGLQQSATLEQINDAVRKAMREWRKRTEAADLGVRQEAEVRVKHIEEARETLTDAARRQQYDVRLTREGVEQAKTVDAGSGDWLSKAKEYLARGDYHAAAYAAREAVQVAGNSAEAWWVRSRANAGVDRFDDALYEAQQAVDLERANPDYHFHLGSVAEGMSRWQQALDEFQEAARIDPTVPMYQLAVGGIYLQNSQPEKAVELIEAVHSKHPDDENANFYLATALLELAQSVPTKRTGDEYMVMSAQEISKMRELIGRAAGLKDLPAETRAWIAHIKDYLDRMEKMRFHLPFGQAKYSGPVASALAVIVIFCFIGLMALGALEALFQGSGGGFLWLIVVGGLAFAWYKLTWVPQWRVSRRVVG